MSTQDATFNHLFMYTKILNNYIKVSLGSLLPSTDKKCYKNLSKASEFGQHLPRIINWKDVNSSFILVIILVSLLGWNFTFEPNVFCSMCTRGWGRTPGKPIVKSWQWMTPLNGSHDWHLINIQPLLSRRLVYKVSNLRNCKVVLKCQIIGLWTF